MLRATRYPLFLLVAVLLALPQGWCCLLGAEVRAATPETPPADCCCCPPPPTEKDEAPPRPPRCCCGDRDLLADKGPESVREKTLPPAHLPPFRVEPTATHLPAEAFALPPPPNRPLHLLRCVWLC